MDIITKLTRENGKLIIECNSEKMLDIIQHQLGTEKNVIERMTELGVDK